MHPWDILIWCLQLLLTLPVFNASWRRLRHKDISRCSGSESSEISSSSSCPSNGFSQFTQSTMDGSIRCGRSVAYPLFTKAVNLLSAISNSLRLLPKEDFGLHLIFTHFTFMCFILEFIFVNLNRDSTNVGPLSLQTTDI
ncbi:unnamed protein product [Trichobilharzia regenti]|nr:unnamed protein product [Trichobilharzia regenti]